MRFRYPKRAPAPHQVKGATSGHHPSMSTGFPCTVIIRHPRENPRKCSILPLRGRSDLVFFNYPPARPPSLEGYVRLAAKGPALSPDDASRGLLLLDGSWRWAEVMNRDFQGVPPRSLTGFRSAYPRISKEGTDPANGLATVEALFVAYQVLGRDTHGLLKHYRWAKEFLRLNDLG